MVVDVVAVLVVHERHRVVNMFWGVGRASFFFVLDFWIFLGVGVGWGVGVRLRGRSLFILLRVTG